LADKVIVDENGDSPNKKSLTNLFK